MPKKPRARKGDHVIADGAGGKCLHCGATLSICLPIDLEAFCAAVRRFVRKHQNCKPNDDRFLSGVFLAMQHLVLLSDHPTFAAEIAKSCGIKREWALAESKRTGYEVRRMNKFIKEELPE